MGDDHDLEGKPDEGSVVEVVLMWGGAAQQAELYRGDFRVRAGSEGEVDYVLPTPPFTLLAADGPDLTLELPGDATGAFATSIGAVDIRFWAVGPDGLRRGKVPRSARGLVHVGSVDFLIRAVHTPELLPVTPIGPKLREARWGALSILAHAAALASIFLVPPTAMSLSVDNSSARSRSIQASMAPAELEQEPQPEWLQSQTQGGMDGQPSQGQEGTAGRPESTQRNRRMQVRGPRDNTAPRIPQASAEERARTAGILGILRASSAPEGHVYGAAGAEGNALATLWGNVMGDEPGEAFGAGGLGMRGTGRGGCPIGQRCDAAGTVGDGTGNLVGTIGGCTRERLAQLVRDLGRSRALDMCTGGSGGPGHGPVLASGARNGGVPRPMVRGVADPHGALSREQIRRTVHLHMNEVRFCYEQALQANPELDGRVVVRFVVAGQGNVLTAVTQSSTLGAAPGQCVSSAVKRWSFPAADDGGITSVNYPFTFTRAE